MCKIMDLSHTEQLGITINELDHQAKIGMTIIIMSYWSTRYDISCHNRGGRFDLRMSNSRGPRHDNYVMPAELTQTELGMTF